MDVLNDAEISDLTKRSALVAKYEKVVDNESAYEILVAEWNRLHRKRSRLQPENL
jgi:hypothetical protein